MKLIVAGSRSWRDPKKLIMKLDSYRNWPNLEIVSGGADGADKHGEDWARLRNIPIKQFLPDYENYPAKIAPIVRNREMAEYADQLIAFWDGLSTGTLNMIQAMCKKRKIVKVFMIHEVVNRCEKEPTK